MMQLSSKELPATDVGSSNSVVEFLDIVMQVSQTFILPEKHKITHQYSIISCNLMMSKRTIAGSGDNIKMFWFHLYWCPDSKAAHNSAMTQHEGLHNINGPD